MYLALRAIMQENNIPEYEVTETDQLVLNNWHLNNPDFGTLDGRICNLAKRIYSFDYFYTYSDCGATYRNWSKVADEITEELRVLPDREMAEFLGKHRNADMAQQLAVTFPFLAQKSYSLYASLIHKGFTRDEAIILISIEDWLMELSRDVYAADYNGFVLYASDIEKAAKYLRKGDCFDALHNHPLKPLTVPNSFLIRLKALGEILEVRKAYTVLKKNLACGYRLNIQYVQGFTIYHALGMFIMI